MENCLHMSRELAAPHGKLPDKQAMGPHVEGEGRTYQQLKQESCREEGEGLKSREK